MMIDEFSTRSTNDKETHEDQNTVRVAFPTIGHLLVLPLCLSQVERPHLVNGLVCVMCVEEGIAKKEKKRGELISLFNKAKLISHLMTLPIPKHLD